MSTIRDPFGDQNIMDAIEENGFDLEWRVAESLKANGLAVHQNVRGIRRDEPGSDQKDLPETDIIATRKNLGATRALFIECKGASSESVLVMIESPQITRHVPRLYVSKNRVIVNQKDIFVLGRDHKHAYCETGDFFVLAGNGGRKTKSGLRISNKESNLYKALTQVSSGINANFDRFCDPASGPVEVVPVIVTNALIRAVNIPGKRVDTRPWVMMASPTEFNDESDIGQRTWGVDGSVEWKGSKTLPGIWIVNEHLLSSFLDYLES